MTLEPIDPIVEKICEYFDGVFTLQHTVPQDRVELAKILAPYVKDHVAMEAVVAERDRLRQQLEEARQYKIALNLAIGVAKLAYEHWDAGRDSKVGKILLALSGQLPGDTSKG